MCHSFGIWANTATSVVFPRKNFKEFMMHGSPEGSLGLVDSSGWMTAANFIKVMKHFITNVRPSKDHQVVLIMDNHQSHLSYAVADRGVSGPWGPQFCEALGNGEAQRLPAGGAGSPQVGSEAKPRRQTHFGNNILKIG